MILISKICSCIMFKLTTLGDMSNFSGVANKQRRQRPIPKEAPWKTLVLNKQFRRERGCEFSTATSGTERERGFVGIGLCRSASFATVFS